MFEKKSSKSEVCNSSQHLNATMLWIGDVEDADSIDDLITSASMTRESIPDFRES